MSIMVKSFCGRNINKHGNILQVDAAVDSATDDANDFLFDLRQTHHITVLSTATQIIIDDTKDHLTHYIITITLDVREIETTMQRDTLPLGNIAGSDVQCKAAQINQWLRYHTEYDVSLCLNTVYGCISATLKKNGEYVKSWWGARIERRLDQVLAYLQEVDGPSAS